MASPGTHSRRGPATAISLLLLFVAMLIPIHPGPATAATKPAKILLVGDSITHGSAGDYTWRYRLWQHLTSNGVAVDFVGPSTGLYDAARSTADTMVETDAYAAPAFDRDHGARWGRFLGSWPGYPTGAVDTIGSQVATYQPDYVVVLLGFNELAWFRTLASSAVADEMSTFVTNARANRSTVRLVLVGLPPTNTAEHDATFAGRVAEYNQRLSDLAATRSTSASPIVYVPPPAGYEADVGASPHDSYDGTHPNARGEIRIAGAVADVLSARFRLGPAYALSPNGVPTGPVLPFTLRCVPGNGSATLTWNESPGATGYWYQRREVGGSWEPSAYQLTMADSPLTNVWLTNGVTYEYRLQAAKWYDKGVYSNVCQVTPGS